VTKRDTGDKTVYNLCHMDNSDTGDKTRYRWQNSDTIYCI